MRIGTGFIVVGVVLVGIGVVIRFAPGLVSWFGKLPGDIRIERESVTIFIPITSMILVSVLLSVVFALVNRLRG